MPKKNLHHAARPRVVTNLPTKEHLQDAVEIQVPSDPRLLKIVRASISHLCDLLDFTEDERNGTTLAVDEACSNIIKHAYGGETTQPIIITCRLLDKGIEIVLRDFGRRADIKSIKSRELDDVRPGGLGVHLIKSVMDVVIYDNTLKEGNRLTLVKYTRGKEEVAC